MSGLYALLAAAAFFTVGHVAQAADSVGRYADVNGLHMYYEVHGEGTPILLIHGGSCTIDACFGDLIEKLASTRKVVGRGQLHRGRGFDKGAIKVTKGESNVDQNAQ
jgi:hypothetical protein